MAVNYELSVQEECKCYKEALSVVNESKSMNTSVFSDEWSMNFFFYNGSNKIEFKSKYIR